MAWYCTYSLISLHWSISRETMEKSGATDRERERETVRSDEWDGDSLPGERSRVSHCSSVERRVLRLNELRQSSADENAENKVNHGAARIAHHERGRERYCNPLANPFAPRVSWQSRLTILGLSSSSSSSIAPSTRWNRADSRCPPTSPFCPRLPSFFPPRRLFKNGAGQRRND